MYVTYICLSDTIVLIDGYDSHGDDISHDNSPWVCHFAVALTRLRSSSCANSINQFVDTTHRGAKSPPTPPFTKSNTVIARTCSALAHPTWTIRQSTVAAVRSSCRIIIYDLGSHAARTNIHILSTHMLCKHFYCILYGWSLSDRQIRRTLSSHRIFTHNLFNGAPDFCVLFGTRISDSVNSWIPSNTLYAGFHRWKCNSSGFQPSDWHLLVVCYQNVRAHVVQRCYRSYHCYWAQPAAMSWHKLQNDLWSHRIVFGIAFTVLHIVYMLENVLKTHMNVLKTHIVLMIPDEYDF